MCSGMEDKGAWRIDGVLEHWEGGMHMDEKIVFIRCVDGLESVSLRLKKLNNMIMAISLGMKQEKMEQQAIDCVENIGYCVNDIKNISLDRLEQIKELQESTAEKKHE